MDASAYSVTESPPSRCFCRGEIPHPKALYDQNEPAVDDVLKASSQSIDFWPRLKSCQDCLHGRLEELLGAYNKVVVMLQATASMFREPDSVSSEALSSGALSTDTSRHLDLAALRGQPQASPATTGAPSVLSGGGSGGGGEAVPPMFLGELRLDHEQSVALLRIVYHGVLKRLASVLYEMRHIETGLDAKLEHLLSDLLYKVLDLMEPCTAGG